MSGEPWLSAPGGMPGVQVGHRNVASLAGTDALALPDAPPVTSHVAHIAFSGSPFSPPDLSRVAHRGLGCPPQLGQRAASRPASRMLTQR